MGTLPLTMKAKQRYLKKLPDKIWKVLPLSEQLDIDYKVYLKRLLDDMVSANDLFDGVFVDIIVKLNVVYIKDLNHAEIRSRVLECANSVDRIEVVE